MPDDGSKAEQRKAARQASRARFDQEMEARLEASRTSDRPFVERLVRFWSNHFTVSRQQSNILHLCGAFEREAIRPHLFGRFEDLLLAVVKHPAMLMYLDNHQSVGPDSLIGQKCELGLNENLAREILELHTLGVDGGYTQTDVIALANVITGWGALPQPDKGDPDDLFRFQGARHEPGAQTILGRSFDAADQRQGEEALRFVARHPSTARFVCTKLVRHFLADTPPAALVDRLVADFTASAGDLRRLTEALVNSPEAWEQPMTKLRTPEEWLLAVLRALGSKAETTRGPKAALVEGWLQDQDWLGQPVFTASSPAGWPDTNAAWAGPEQLLRRIALSERYGRRSAGALGDVSAWLNELLGPAAPAALLRAVADAPSAPAALALAFASPTFLRR